MYNSKLMPISPFPSNVRHVILILRTILSIGICLTSFPSLVTTSASSSSSSSSSASSSSCEGSDSCAQNTDLVAAGQKHLELKQVSLVMRHGARTPITVFPTDPNKVEDWPSRPGTLTNQGLEQHFLLGQHLHRVYVQDGQFLNPCYDQKDIYVRSTDYDRTIRSAMANMAGMYPPCSSSPPWNPSLHWSPVTIHSAMQKHDLLMTYWSNCPRLMRSVDEIFESAEEVKLFTEKNALLLKFIRQESGWERGFREMWKIGDCLKSERENNLTWASWANETIYDLLIDIEILNFKVYSYNQTMKRYTAGNMLREIMDNLENTKNGTSVEKMRIYSGHDTSVISLLAAMDLWNFKKVNYASYIAFQLLKDANDGQYYVKVVLRDDDNFSDPQPVEQSLPFCQNKILCPLRDFKKFAEIFYIDDWESECSLEETPSHRIHQLEQTVTALTVIVAMVIAALLCIAGYAGFQLTKWKHRYENDFPIDTSQVALQS